MHVAAAFVKTGLLFTTTGIENLMMKRNKEQYWKDQEAENSRLREEERDKEGKTMLKSFQNWLIATCFLMLVISQGVNIWRDDHYSITILDGDKTLYMLVIGLMWAIPAIILIKITGVRAQIIGTAIYGGVMWGVYVFVKGLFGVTYNMEGIVTSKWWITIKYVMDVVEAKEYTERAVFPGVLQYLRDDPKMKDVDIWSIMDELKEKVHYEGITTMRGCVEMVDDVILKIIPSYCTKTSGVFGGIIDFMRGAGSVVYNHPVMFIMVVVLSAIMAAKISRGDDTTLRSLFRYTEGVNDLSNELCVEVEALKKEVAGLKRDTEGAFRALDLGKSRADWAEETLQKLEKYAIEVGEITGVNTEEIAAIRKEIKDLFKNVKK